MNEEAESSRAQISEVLDSINEGWLKGDVQKLPRFFDPGIIIVLPGFGRRIEGGNAFLVSLGVPHWRARKLGGSGRGWWRMAACPQASEAMSIQWFKDQNLVSLTERYLTLSH